MTESRASLYYRAERQAAIARNELESLHQEFTELGTNLAGHVDDEILFALGRVNAQLAELVTELDRFMAGE